MLETLDVIRIGKIVCILRDIWMVAYSHGRISHMIPLGMENRMRFEDNRMSNSRFLTLFPFVLC
jgi:hypothetical protein